MVENVQSIKEEQAVGVEAANSSLDVSEDICPRCGGKLVKRVAKTGKYAGNNFMGCTNYPKCRYIKNE